MRLIVVLLVSATCCFYLSDARAHSKSPSLAHQTFIYLDELNDANPLSRNLNDPKAEDNLEQEEIRPVESLPFDISAVTKERRPSRRISYSTGKDLNLS